MNITNPSTIIHADAEAEFYGTDISKLMVRRLKSAPDPSPSFVPDAVVHCLLRMDADVGRAAIDTPTSRTLKDGTAGQWAAGGWVDHEGQPIAKSQAWALLLNLLGSLRPAKFRIELDETRTPNTCQQLLDETWRARKSTPLRFQDEQIA
jgi:hypothetical protein